MLRQFLFVLMLFGAGALLAPASAHQQKAALTQILFNPRSGTIEIVHRFYLHDAEQAAVMLYGPKADIYTNEDTRLKFALYTADKFGLWDEKDAPIELGLLGSEIDGSFFYVYQESETSLDVTALTVRHDVLRDIWPNQMNTVNVEGKGPLQTLLFSGNEAVQAIAFD